MNRIGGKVRRAMPYVLSLRASFRASAKFPLEFLKGWSGTLLCDGYGVYDQVLKEESRVGAACFAHARRKFDELIKDNLSPVGGKRLGIPS